MNEALLGEQKGITISTHHNPDDPWIGLRANIYHRPLAVLNTHEPTALGAMALAAVGIGLYPDLRTAMPRFTGRSSTIYPDADTAENYLHLYRLLLSAEESLGQLMRQWETVVQPGSDPSAGSTS